ncbi:RagB/SusD family nutrient uptake outer membrane protein [Mucilaginibacter limnophilus]|uniref:RagB/SusD family nutrient uptake outer membrane protein n=1 Tax=Mucilaginibacter limnophilus TaxID=1932778 RepID=A0A3S2URN0_9SPHI|nr:RagB/SusD family nutrient uptake outer membrane protein [Mucilaginibacter limnophilus]RVU02988.1 RagB/SusD family nutrient uptake outer membrane protein [Mucilaginibacter limnophilus]
MKRIFKLLLAALLIGGTSCNKYLDVVPAEYSSENDVYNNINLAEQALARLYNALPNELTSPLTAATDETYHHWFDNGEAVDAYKYNLGSWSTNDNPYGNWSGRYQDIRRANIFISRIDNVPVPLDRESYYAIWKPRYKAEARFLRALFYFELFKRYGAVPLLTDAGDVDPDNLEDTQVSRNSVDEVVGFIASECDDIANALPLSQDAAQTGRITKGAALALKARTLLYAASPLFNGNPLYAGVKNKDGKALFNASYDKEKWKAAADAAKAVIDLGVYSLYNPFPNNPVQNYAAQFYTRDYTETILPRIMGNSTDIDGNYLPNGSPFKGNGKLTPLQQFVDAYEMKNGYPINVQGSGYTTNGFWSGELWDGLKFQSVSNISNMYKDRDPRFYASVFFQYDVWRFDATRRPVRLAWFGSGNGVTDGWATGKPGTNPWGYNVRKFLSPNYDRNANSGTGTRNFPIFRLAEIYLNYAEAMNEYLDAPDQSVYQYVNLVRGRVSMPSLPILPDDNTKAGMRKRIQNERRVELAFESHRFWDVRRWLIAKTVDNGPALGLNARPSAAELQATGLPESSEEAGVAVFYKTVTLQDRKFEDKHYLMPIPQPEIDKDPNLVQNYGW